MPIQILNWTESDGRSPTVLFENHIKDSTVLSPEGANHVKTESTFDGWTFTLDSTITFDLSEAKGFSAFGIVGHSGGPIGVKLFTSNDNITYQEVVPGNPHIIDKGTTSLFLFNKKNARYFRVQLTGSGERVIRHMRLGNHLEISAGVGYGYTPIWLSVQKELLISETLNGQFVGNRVISKGARTEVPLLSVERSFLEEDLLPFMDHYNDGKPFIFASGPTLFKNDVAYVWRQNGAEMKPTFDQSGNWMSLTMNVQGYVQ